jgi:hypothetical protein
MRICEDRIGTNSIFRVYPDTRDPINRLIVELRALALPFTIGSLQSDVKRLLTVGPLAADAAQAFRQSWQDYIRDD